jgi:hypothetical protein
MVVRDRISSDPAIFRHDAGGIFWNSNTLASSMKTEIKQIIAMA